MPLKWSLAAPLRKASRSGQQQQVLCAGPPHPNSPGPGTLLKEVKCCKLQLASQLWAEHCLVGQAWPDSPRPVSGTSGEQRVTAAAPQSRAISDWQETEGSLARGRNV